MYKPPFTINENILNLSMLISEKIEQINSVQFLSRMPILRRNNKIKSVHSSLVIEANSFSLEETKDLINGKFVIGPINEIQEIKNAYKVYNMFEEINCFKEEDLLKAHKEMTFMLDKESGRYRKHGEGVFNGEKLIFVAPPYKMVPKLMNDLFDWLANDKTTPLLIKSCIFHYEFVFIHPFGDGNGRIARLWQNLILTKWKPVFQYIPIESQIVKYQQEYYETIKICNKKGSSTYFIEFMLNMIDKTLNEVLKDIDKNNQTIDYDINKLLSLMEVNTPYSANELIEKLNIKTKETLRSKYLNPAIRGGFIKMTISDKPNSKNQKYIKN